MDGWIIFFLLAAIIWFWWDSANAYENAYQAARQLCRQRGVNFLDDTLARSRLKLCRHVKGYLHLCRQYQFEFSTADGETRYKGWINMQGASIESTEMEAYRIAEEMP